MANTEIEQAEMGSEQATEWHAQQQEQPNEHRGDKKQIDSQPMCKVAITDSEKSLLLVCIEKEVRTIVPIETFLISIEWN